jgi:hypothetical protein
MLFLKGLDCPTQYFDCANSGGGGEVGAVDRKRGRVTFYIATRGGHGRFS